MTQHVLTGKWSQQQIAGHPCHTYVPPEPSQHGYTVLYLHGRYQGVPMQHPQMMQYFDRHGLRILAPLTRRSWWSDRICDDFDPQISVERYLLDHIVPFLQEQWQCQPPRIALMGAGSSS